jgi:hypothetical protein
MQVRPRQAQRRAAAPDNNWPQGMKGRAGSGRPNSPSGSNPWGVCFLSNPCSCTQSMNYFAYPTAAERYANGRPFFHRLVTEKIRNLCYEGGRVNRATDVACGTGQSTLALLEVADEIVGLDRSAEMLSHAGRHPQIRYIEGLAEQTV